LIGSDRHDFRPGIHTLLEPNLRYSILNLFLALYVNFPFQSML